MRAADDPRKENDAVVQMELQYAGNAARKKYDVHIFQQCKTQSLRAALSEQTLKRASGSFSQAKAAFDELKGLLSDALTDKDDSNHAEEEENRDNKEASAGKRFTRFAAPSRRLRL